MDFLTKVRHRFLSGVCLLILISSFIIGSDTTYASDTLVRENKIKAAFLLNIIKLVAWPENVRRDSKVPFSICFIGDASFYSILEDSYTGRKLHNRAISLQKLDNINNNSACDVLYLSLSEEQLIYEFHALLNQRPILTVGESRDFASRGGMIGIFRKGNNMQIEVNLESATRANIEIKSELLNLAKIVGR